MSISSFLSCNHSSLPLVGPVQRTRRHGAASDHGTTDRRVQPPALRSAEEQGRRTFEESEVGLSRNNGKELNNTVAICVSL